MKKVYILIVILIFSTFIFSEMSEKTVKNEKNMVKVIIHHKEHQESFYVNFGDDLEFFNEI